MIYVVVTLLVYLIIREYLFIKTTRDLIDRLMSKSFYDYQVSKAIPEQMSQKDEFTPVAMPEIDQDLELLNAQFRV